MSKFQRITIATCSDCNNGTSDEDAHFRNVILVAGEPNAAVSELWHGPARRAFAQVDGIRRAREIFALMERAPELEGERYMIYPARDERVLRTVRKIVRGLAHFHGLESAIRDDHVIADVMRSPLPDEIIEAMQYHHAELDILQYAFVSLGVGPGIRSLWILRFFERTGFVVAHFGSPKNGCTIGDYHSENWLDHNRPLLLEICHRMNLSSTSGSFAPPKAGNSTLEWKSNRPL